MKLPSESDEHLHTYEEHVLVTVQLPLPSRYKVVLPFLCSVHRVEVHRGCMGFRVWALSCFIGFRVQGLGFIGLGDR